MGENPNYYAVIPAEIRYSNIPDLAKLLYGEITALANKEGYCWANNEYFAKLYSKSIGTISRLISLLDKNGYIKVEIENYSERKIFVGKIKDISSKMSRGLNKNKKGATQKGVGGLLKNDKHNNTSNNINNNINISKDILIENSDSQESSKINFIYEVKVVYGNEEINKMLDFLRESVGIDRFKDTEKWSRIYGKHFLNLLDKIGKEEFVRRLNAILTDNFKKKNSNSIRYLYGEVSAFIHSSTEENITKFI